MFFFVYCYFIVFILHFDRSAVNKSCSFALWDTCLKLQAILHFSIHQMNQITTSYFIKFKQIAGVQPMFLYHNNIRTQNIYQILNSRKP